jgi:hypothetical protein
MNGMEYTPQRGDGPLGGQAGCQADFTYSMRPDVIAITDLDLGNKSVPNDIGNVLRDRILASGIDCGRSKSCTEILQGYGTGSIGTENRLPFLPSKKPTKP